MRDIGQLDTIQTTSSAKGPGSTSPKQRCYRISTIPKYAAPSSLLAQHNLRDQQLMIHGLCICPRVSTCFNMFWSLQKTWPQHAAPVFAPLWPGPRHCLCSSFVDHKFGKQILPMGIKDWFPFFRHQVNVFNIQVGGKTPLDTCL